MPASSPCHDPAEMPQQAAVVYADDFYANAVVAGLTGKKLTIAGTDKVIDLSPGASAEAGIEVVLEQQWPEEGFADWITLANTTKGSGADMVVGYTASPDEAIQLIRALQTAAYQPHTVILGQGTIRFCSAIEVVGKVSRLEKVPNSTSTSSSLISRSNCACAVSLEDWLSLMRSSTGSPRRPPAWLISSMQSS